MMIRQKIIDHHGRVENIKLFDKDPTPLIKEAEEQARQKAAEKEKKASKEEKEDEADEKEEEEKEKPPQYRTFDNSSTTLYEIFGNYGVSMKRELEEDTDEAKSSKGTLYYDFTPYRANDPVLLSLMRSKNTDEDEK